VENLATVSAYYAECAETATGAVTVVASDAGEDEIDYNDATLVDYTGTALYAEAPTDKFVKLYSGDKTLTIKKGNSVQGMEDKAYTITHSREGERYYIRFESGVHKNVYGTDSGKVIVSATDVLVKVAVLCFR
jgi:hypothetical protein